MLLGRANTEDRRRGRRAREQMYIFSKRSGKWGRVVTAWRAQELEGGEGRVAFQKTTKIARKLDNYF
jgi:hypothetical protein